MSGTVALANNFIHSFRSELSDHARTDGGGLYLVCFGYYSIKTPMATRVFHAGEDLKGKD